MECFNTPNAVASGQVGPARASVSLMSPEGHIQNLCCLYSYENNSLSTSLYVVLFTPKHGKILNQQYKT